MNKVTILNTDIDQISRKEIDGVLEQKLNGEELCQIATVNPEFLVEANRNQSFKNALQNANLKICDGIGISLMSRIFLNKKIERISGVEVAERICKTCAKTGKSIFFLGGFGVAKKVEQKMCSKYPELKVAGAMDGTVTTFDAVREASPDAILVAFGAPAQELWIQEFGRRIPSLKIAVGVGGTFDFWTGKALRAPNVLQKLGLEWFWRLILEPHKRGKRIFNAVCVFPYLFVKSLLK
jgi:N-acetylglucosaminyldiphosphoundecaprenol N-acetyl-beta-D-mannosaminyltransferase